MLEKRPGNTPCGAFQASKVERWDTTIIYGTGPLRYRFVAKPTSGDGGGRPVPTRETRRRKSPLPRIASRSRRPRCRHHLVHVGAAPSPSPSYPTMATVKLLRPSHPRGGMRTTDDQAQIPAHAYHPPSGLRRQAGYNTRVRDAPKGRGAGGRLSGMEHGVD